jgi:uncharacterized protein (TIGR03083 family)
LGESLRRAEIHDAVADERRVLVADLARLSQDDWNRPSLCDAWSIRDVVGHFIRLESVYRYSAPFFLGIARYGLRLNTYIREDARRRARGVTTDELVDAFSKTRYETAPFAAWHPIAAVPLSELVVHGQDIRMPLGLTRVFDVQRLVPVANLLKRRLGVLGRGGRPSDVRFEATDTDWSWGKGEVVHAPLESIVMRLAGRRVEV